MSDEDKQAVELLIEEAKSQMPDDFEAALKAAQSAHEAAEMLDPANPELEFEALFLVAACCTALEKHSKGFAHAARLIAMAEDPLIDIGDSKRRLPLTYVCCALCASDLPMIQDEALRISEKGLECCRKTENPSYLYLAHEHSKLLLLAGRYDEAATYAEQLVAEKRLNPESGGCDLDCYQRVYAEALGFSSSLQAGIGYLDNVLSEETQEGYKLWEMRARLHFRAGEYQACLSDCQSAMLLEEEGSTLLLSAQAHMMLGHTEKAVDDLSRLCGLHPTDESITLWYSLFSQDMDRLHRFSDGDAWQCKIMSFLLGETSMDELKKQAGNEDNPDACIGEACSFAGLQLARQGDGDQASTYYRMCLQHSHVMGDSYMWADANLSQIS